MFYSGKEIFILCCLSSKTTMSYTTHKKVSDIFFSTPYIKHWAGKKNKTPQKSHTHTHQWAPCFSSYVIKGVLTRFLGGDIDNAALWTHSSAVISPQRYQIGTAALQIPDAHGRLIPHRPNHTGCLPLLLYPPVLQLKKQKQKNRAQQKVHVIAPHV